ARGDPLEVVVLGDPVARVAQALGVPRELARGAKRLGEVAALGIGDQVEDGKGGVFEFLHRCTSNENGSPQAAVRCRESTTQPIGRIATACLPLGPSFTSNSTFWFSLRVLK